MQTDFQLLIPAPKKATFFIAGDSQYLARNFENTELLWGFRLYGIVISNLILGFHIPDILHHVL